MTRTYQTINGYDAAIEKVGQVWRAQVNGLTICSCNTRKATVMNAEFILYGPLAKQMTTNEAPCEDPMGDHWGKNQ